MQLQVQLLPADAGNPLGAAGPPLPVDGLLTQDSEDLLTEDGDYFVHE